MTGLCRRRDSSRRPRGVVPQQLGAADPLRRRRRRAGARLVGLEFQTASPRRSSPIPQIRSGLERVAKAISRPPTAPFATLRRRRSPTASAIHRQQPRSPGLPRVFTPSYSLSSPSLARSRSPGSTRPVTSNAPELGAPFRDRPERAHGHPRTSGGSFVQTAHRRRTRAPRERQLGFHRPARAQSVAAADDGLRHRSRGRDRRHGGSRDPSRRTARHAAGQPARPWTFAVGNPRPGSLGYGVGEARRSCTNRSGCSMAANGRLGRTPTTARCSGSGGRPGA